MLDYKKFGGSISTLISNEQCSRKVRESKKNKLTKENQKFLSLLKKILKGQGD